MGRNENISTLILFSNYSSVEEIQITVTGENMDSVAEPIMVVVVVNLLTGDPSIFYQVCSNHLQWNHLSKIQQSN